MTTRPGALDPKRLEPFIGKPLIQPAQPQAKALVAPVAAGMGGVVSSFGEIVGDEIDFDPISDLTKTHAALGDDDSDIENTHIDLQRVETGSQASQDSVQEIEESDGKEFCGCLEGILPECVVQFLEDLCLYFHNLIIALLTGETPQVKPQPKAANLEDEIPEELIPRAVTNQLNAAIDNQIVLWRERLLVDIQWHKEFPEDNVRDNFKCRLILILQAQVGEEIRTRTIFNRVYDKLNRRNFTKDMEPFDQKENEVYAKLAGFDQGGQVEDFTLFTLSLYKYPKPGWTKADPFTARVFAYGFDESSMQKVQRVEFNFYSLKTIRDAIKRKNLPAELSKEDLTV